MGSPRARQAILRQFGALVIVLNAVVAAISLSDMCLLASGAVKVEPPTEKDFSWHFDQERNAIVFCGNYTVQNRGFYDITDLDIGASVRSAGGAILVQYARHGLRIPAFGGGRYPIVAEMPLEKLLDLDYGSMLLNGTHFDIHVALGASYILGMARFRSDETIKYPWKPPLEDFAGMFLNGSLGSALKDALPFLKDAAGYLGSWVAASILAKGENVTCHAGPVDLDLRYHAGLLDIVAILPGQVPQVLFRTTLVIPAGGGGDVRQAQ